MIQLDRKRPYGQVYGSPNVGYEQDGKSFDHDGNELPSPRDIVQAKKDKAAAKSEPDQVTAQLGA